MRLSPYTISIGIVLLVACMVPFLGSKSQAQRPELENVRVDPFLPEHPVTPQMTRDAAKMDRKTAPQFTRPSSQGVSVSISGKPSKPQFVLFILDGCPCGEDAQPIFNAFSKHWKGKVEFIGVIDSAPAKAKKWIADYRPLFPVIPDSKKEIIKAYHAKQSVYSVLISREGQIVKLWPGYSTDLLGEMNEALAKEIGESPLAFDTQYAPKLKTSGCFF